MALFNARRGAVFSSINAKAHAVSIKGVMVLLVHILFKASAK